VVRDPELRKKFQYYANDAREAGDSIEFVEERGQRRPVDWPKAPSGSMRKRSLPIVRRQWVRVGTVADFPKEGGATIRYGGAQIAVFQMATEGRWYATQNLCPHKRDMVLSRGIVGDAGGTPKVACPMHKKAFSLETGKCLNDDAYEIATFDVKVVGQDVLVELPPADTLGDISPCKPEMTESAPSALSV